MITKIIATSAMILSLAQTGSVTHYVREEPEPVIVRAEVTAYTSSKDETDDTPHITASGKTTKHGIVACPRQYPFGTRVEILGKEYVCEDRMNRRYDDEWDIWMQTKQEAFNFGRKTLSIKLL